MLLVDQDQLVLLDEVCDRLQKNQGDLYGHIEELHRDLHNQTIS